MADLPTGTVTLLFTDIEGSTKLMHDVGPESYAAALTEHRGALRLAFTRHGGTEVDTQGDAFFYAFANAHSAVTAATEAQQMLARGPISVRMGVHTGTPHRSESGYVGSDVHLAARICAAGHGGQVILSKQTAQLVDDQLTDLGEHRLKDFTAPVWLYQLGAARFPPLRTRMAAGHAGAWLQPPQTSSGRQPRHAAPGRGRLPPPAVRHAARERAR